MHGEWEATKALAVSLTLNFPLITLDAAYVAYERDVGDVNGDGVNDAAFSQAI